MSEGWYFLDLNPEPWAVGPLALGRRNGKMFPKMERNKAVHSYKEAVKSELEGSTPLPVGLYDLEFYFWRRLDSYTGETGRKVNAHVADATNMQKALEDALQGVIFDNDRDVREIRSVIVEQGADVKPCIVIHAQPWVETNILDWLPVDIQERVRFRGEPAATWDNSWGGPPV